MAEAMQEDDPQLDRSIDFVGSFALDVLLYTLKVSGGERHISLLNAPDSGYSNPNFVRIAAVSVLRLCLTYRDEWKEKIAKLCENVSTYDAVFFGKCLVYIVARAASKAEDEEKASVQLNVEITLAIATEMALHLISQDKRFDLLALVGSATSNIIFLIDSPFKRAYNRTSLREARPPVNFKEELENLFSEFDNIWELLKFIEDFIKTYAIPYGSRENVPEIFYREVGKRWKRIFEGMFCGRKPSKEVVITNLGFLPRAAYNSIVAETSVPMPKYSQVAWGRKLSKSSASSEGGNESSKRQPTASGSASTTQAGPSSKDSSKQTAEGGQSSKDSSKALQGDQGEKDSSKQTAQVENGSRDSSKQAAQGGQSSKDSSEQTVEGGQSSMDSSDPGLDLGSEGNSLASQGAIPKSKDPKK